ncbi:MAG TPA: ferrous iron transporter B [Steroidobacteraceae bacterium]|jgi:ferrous iron transport protein B|nr:ferrous iron transporter B [Steroidobacteraceae bacterium]
MTSHAAASTSPLVALVGNPNCGKTALFNLLTGSRQKIANYAGVTVERKEGTLHTANGRTIRVLDLPGSYSLNPQSMDEQVVCDVLFGRRAGEPVPDLLVAVVDATNLRQHLRLVLGLKRLGRPLIVALNMVDLARRRGLNVDSAALARELGVPVVETVAVRADGSRTLAQRVEHEVQTLPPLVPPAADAGPSNTLADHREVQRILRAIGAERDASMTFSDRIDRVLLHPVLGLVILAGVLFLIFQAVFSWAKPVMDAIQAGVSHVGAWLAAALPAGPLRSLLVDGVIAGVGSVLVFLPQIIILFFFILLLEDSGYLPRAAFLLDRLMGGVGLSGRSFIPLLSSFACAIPGIMATRTIPSARDRLVTIMVAPLMTCSARLPVYALLIAAFIPALTVGKVFQLQGLVLFVLYVAGVAGAMLVAWLLKVVRSRHSVQTLQMELPAYHWPSLRSLRIGLWQRVEIFLTRVGTIILSLMVLLWFLSTFPAPPPGATGPAIEYSLAGRLGAGLAVIFGPIGFNWKICIALVVGLAAREVAVGALGTVYALSAAKQDIAGDLIPMISSEWGLATALALLAWYVFAPQCLSTLAVVKRETNSWRYPLIMAGYMFLLAYLAAGLTFHISHALGA